MKRTREEKDNTIFELRKVDDCIFLDLWGLREESPITFFENVIMPLLGSNYIILSNVKKIFIKSKQSKKDAVGEFWINELKEILTLYFECEVQSQNI